jgi:hypothetical protein
MGRKAAKPRQECAVRAKRGKPGVSERMRGEDLIVCGPGDVARVNHQRMYDGEHGRAVKRSDNDTALD